MTILKFKDREHELSILKKALPVKKDIKYIVIFGRRRIGKTRLVQEFAKMMKNYELIYFYVDKKSLELLLRDFSEYLWSKGILPEGVIISNLEALLEFLADYAKKKKVIIVFDEFQNFNYVYPAAYSIFQKFYDYFHLHINGKESNLFIIFLGSYVGLMKRLFYYKEPLYGRVHQYIYLRPLSFKYVSSILDDLGIKDIEKQLEFYFVLGGIPKYYEIVHFYNIKSIREFIKLAFVSREAILKDEIKNTLLEEFGRDYKTYFSILEAISVGNSKLTEISNYSGIEIKNMHRFLYELIEIFDLVKRESYSLKDRKTKKTVYSIVDPITSFWFRYIYKNASLLESGNYDLLLKKIMDNINSFFGVQFEELCRKNVHLFFDNFFIARRWFGSIKDEYGIRKEAEIDIVAINEQTKEILFAECKWQNKVNAEKIVKKLSEKSKFVKWHNEKRKESFAIFAKSFSKRIKEWQGKPVYCFDLKYLEKVLKKKR